jgi:L-asparagine transporter-like permease
MRVFYPVSARLSDIVNHEAYVPSGWRLLWSAICFALFVSVLSALPSFEAGATALKSATEPKASIQEYIDAHRYEQYSAPIKPVVTLLPLAVPTKSKANNGKYL